MSLINVAVLLLAVCAANVSALPNFTGNVKTDFPADSSSGTDQKSNSQFGVVSTTWDDREGDDDVGLPREFPLSVFSGWDVDSIRFIYDESVDTLAIGVDCLVVCGDADGNGAASAGSILQGNGGDDLANMEGTESFVLAFDLGTNGSNSPDGIYDIVIGYPSNTRPSTSDPFPCEAGGTEYGTDCFGVYLFDNAGPFSAQIQPASRFVYTTQGGILPHPATDHNPSPTTGRPDLEWSITEFDALRQKFGIPAIFAEWSFDFALFAGSFQDDGIGEDLFPNAGVPATVNFPCPVLDVCDVCRGDGLSCLDCNGTPFGTFGLNSCGQCVADPSDSSTCVPDCAGVLFGTSVYDQCDVCNGNNDCFDCRGVPNGTCEYDACDECCGDGSGCLPPPECAVFPEDHHIHQMYHQVEEWDHLRAHLLGHLTYTKNKCAGLMWHSHHATTSETIPEAHDDDDDHHGHHGHHSSSSSHGHHGPHNAGTSDSGHHGAHLNHAACEEQIAAIREEVKTLTNRIGDMMQSITLAKAELKAAEDEVWAGIKQGRYFFCSHSSSSSHSHSSSSSSSSSSHSHHHHHHHHGHHHGHDHHGHHHGHHHHGDDHTHDENGDVVVVAQTEEPAAGTDAGDDHHHGHHHGHHGHGHHHGHHGHGHGHGHSSSSSSSGSDSSTSSSSVYHHLAEQNIHLDFGHHGHGHDHSSSSSSSSSSDHGYHFGHGHGHSSSSHGHGHGHDHSSTSSDSSFGWYPHSDTTDHGHGHHGHGGHGAHHGGHDNYDGHW